MPRVNLVPIEEKKKELRRRFYIVPFAGAAVLLIAMGTTYYYFDQQVTDTQSQAQEYKQANDMQAPKVKEIGEYEAIQAHKQDRQSSVVSLYSQRIRWSRILDDLAFVIPDDIWLDSVQGEVPGMVIKTEQKAGETKKTNDFVIDGHTNDMATVAIFMVRLTLIPSLTNVTLITAEKEQVEGGGLAMHFEIGADLSQAVEITGPAVAPTTGEEGPSDATSTNAQTSTGRTTQTGTTTTGSRTSTTRTSTTSNTSTGSVADEE